MQCLVVYDISDDNKRGKVADACLDYGLDRIQYSAFLGPLLPTHREELMLRIKQVIGRRPANVQLFPICETDWRERLVLVNHAGDGGNGKSQTPIAKPQDAAGDPKFRAPSCEDEPEAGDEA